jgi:hypothetical protein
MKSPVVYLTEQGDSSFRQALARARLLGREDLHVVAWKDTIGIPWEEVVRQAEQLCLEVGAMLLVVDTLSQFAGIDGDRENSSGDALAATQPLQLAGSVNNIGVVAARHERKSGGDVAESGRGSSAYAGAADIVVSLRRPEGNANPTLRVLHAIGRYDETPSVLQIELTAEGYRSLGEKALGVERARQKLLEVLPGEEDTARTVEDLRVAAGFSRSVLQEALEVMIDEGVVGKAGTGRRGSPYRYWRA